VPTAIVPDLVGADAAQAEAELEKLGLRPVPLEAAGSTAPAGTVYAQLPEAGKEVPKTYPVLLLVSTGPGAQATPLPAGE
jgi:beta-lactam-binding protein with PASTA domain